MTPRDQESDRMTPTDLPDAPFRRAAVSVRRRVNDEILNAATRLDDGSMLFEFVCECGDLKCRHWARMTLADYRATSPGSVVSHR